MVAHRREQVRVVDQRLGDGLGDSVGSIFRNILEQVPREPIELGSHLEPVCSNATVQLGKLGLRVCDEFCSIVKLHCDVTAAHAVSFELAPEVDSIDAQVLCRSHRRL